MKLKIFFLTLLIISIAAIHLYSSGSSNMIYHILHQQLFLIPLVIAGFWFGLLPGAIVAVGVSLLYGLPLVMGDHGSDNHFLVTTQVALYIFITVLVGWLSDTQHKQQYKLLQGERITTLGKAASALSFEVQDIARRIEEIFMKSGGLKNPDADKDMQEEIERLEKLLEALGDFKPSFEELVLSEDLNDTVQHSLLEYYGEGRSKEVKLVLDLDPMGCSSMVHSESIPRILGSLITNAIDVSTKGQNVILRTHSGGASSVVEVIDSGPGVLKENENRLFSAFFTTKPDGYGLSLSSGRKVLRELGGDLTYEPGEQKGAIFKMIIPRENNEEDIVQLADQRSKM